jgi:hypothetical protein
VDLLHLAAHAVVRHRLLQAFGHVVQRLLVGVVLGGRDVLQHVVAGSLNAPSPSLMKLGVGPAASACLGAASAAAAHPRFCWRMRAMYAGSTMIGASAGGRRRGRQPTSGISSLGVVGRRRQLRAAAGRGATRSTAATSATIAAIAARSGIRPAR